MNGTMLRLPAKMHGKTYGCTSAQKQFEAIGIAFGERSSSTIDAILPAGWSEQPTGDEPSFWSRLIDERGIERVAIFRRVSITDDESSMSILNVGADLVQKVLYTDSDDIPVIPWTALDAEESRDAALAVGRTRRDLEEHPDIYARHQARINLIMESMPQEWHEFAEPVVPAVEQERKQ